MLHNLFTIGVNGKRRWGLNTFASNCSRTNQLQVGPPHQLIRIVCSCNPIANKPPVANATPNCNYQTHLFNFILRKNRIPRHRIFYDEIATNNDLGVSLVR